MDTEILARILRRWPIARLAVTVPDSGPWMVPLVFAPDPGADPRAEPIWIWSPVDGKPKRSAALARLALLQREPRATLLIDEYSAQWSALWWVRLAVSAAIVRLDPARAEAHPGTAALRAKYPQYRTIALFSGPPTLLAFEVTAVRAWAAAGTASWRTRFAEAGTDAALSGSGPGPARRR